MHYALKPSPTNLPGRLIKNIYAPANFLTWETILNQLCFSFCFYDILCGKFYLSLLLYPHMPE